MDGREKLECKCVFWWEEGWILGLLSAGIR